MTLRSSIIFLLLWSSQTFGQTESSVPMISSAFTANKGLEVVPNSENIVPNMPKIQSQDTVGSCFGCSAATIVQKFHCDTNSYLKTIPCADSPKDKTVSQFSMVSWAETDKPGQTPNAYENHNNIKLYKKDQEKEDRGELTGERTEVSSGSNALQNFVGTPKFMPESCYPFDQLVNKYGNTNGSLFQEVYLNTKKLYKAHHKSTEGDGQCEECLEQLSRDLVKTITPDIFSSAIKKDTFGKFFYELIFHNCTPVRTRPPTFRQLPDGNDKMPRVEVLPNLEKIIKEKKKPVQVNSVFLGVDPKTKQRVYHTLVVSGTRTVCPPDKIRNRDFNSSECKKEVKIHNCWGDDWQKRNNDGWVDADSLTKTLNDGKDHVTTGELSWLE